MPLNICACEGLGGPLEYATFFFPNTCEVSFLLLELDNGAHLQFNAVFLGRSCGDELVVNLGLVIFLRKS